LVALLLGLVASHAAATCNYSKKMYAGLYPCNTARIRQDSLNGLRERDDLGRGIWPAFHRRGTACHSARHDVGRLAWVRGVLPNAEPPELLRRVQKELAGPWADFDRAKSVPIAQAVARAAEATMK
jgi:hypothetical protein